MMDASFWVKLGLSFCVGSLWVTLTTLSAERLGSKLGGLIGGLPSTVLIALLFIGITQSPQVAAQATTLMPLAQGLNGLFVLTFLLLIKRGLPTALAGSLAVWLLSAVFLFFLDLQYFFISVLGWLLLFGLCFVVLEKMKIRSQEKQAFSYPASQLIWRALFGGSVIAIAVLMGKIGGPSLGGIFSSFPAIFLSTLIITSRVGGPEYCRSVGKSLLVSGLINVPLYEIMVRLLYPSIGLVMGTIAAVLFSLGTGYLTYQFMKNRLV